MKNKTVTETLKNGLDLFFSNQDEYFSTTFYYTDFQISISLKHNSFSQDEKMEYVNVSFYSRAVNKMKHLKLYCTKKGYYFMTYGKRIYLNELVRLSN